jgi:hypothetical protein
MFHLSQLSQSLIDGDSARPVASRRQDLTKLSRMSARRFPASASRARPRYPCNRALPAAAGCGFRRRGLFPLAAVTVWCAPARGGRQVSEVLTEAVERWAGGAVRGGYIK